MSADRAAANKNPRRSVDQRVRKLLAGMTLEEKIGQMTQAPGPGAHLPPDFAHELRSGRIGSVLNEVEVDIVNEMQRITVEESRLGIPLLIGRDVIHGFKTIFPIPLGQAATWNPALVRDAARISAAEAAKAGVNWTFAPMIDITRDPRWGRIAESPGEDPFLASEMAVAMVRGFQGDDLEAADTIAACAKHFAGYGATESGRDYNTALIPENELRNVHLRPFKAAADAGVSTFMASFSDLNGVPATGNEFLMRRILRDEWSYEGFVISDWDSIRQLAVHGFTEGDRESALAAVRAGIDMEMASTTYRDHLAALVESGVVAEAVLDELVGNILRAKFELGLFERPYTDPDALPATANDAYLKSARDIAAQSIVMLKNDHAVLPLSVSGLSSIAVIGPLADAPYEQLGTWIFDGDASLSVTPLSAIRDYIGDHAGDDVAVHHARGTQTTRSRSEEGFEEALDAANKADAVLLFIGEESILSGEAHSRADIDLPGNQAALVSAIRKAGKPVIAVILAGRPLTLGNIVDEVDAILFAWHPGTMAGPAIRDILFGVESPSGKLPVTFPRMVGQIPIYYCHKNTGKPATWEQVVHIDDIDPFAPQTSLGMSAFHLDAGFTPLFAFGYGLSYATFDYRNIDISAPEIDLGDSVTVSATVQNTGRRAADEIVQLYIRDLVGNVTRPVKELKGFKRIRLDAGEAQRVAFTLSTDELGFVDRHMNYVTEPGEFHAWIGGSSEAELRTEFRIRAAR